MLVSVFLVKLISLVIVFGTSSAQIDPNETTTKFFSPQSGRWQPESLVEYNFTLSIDEENFHQYKVVPIDHSVSTGKRVEHRLSLVVQKIGDIDHQVIACTISDNLTFTLQVNENDQETSLVQSGKDIHRLVHRNVEVDSLAYDPLRGAIYLLDEKKINRIALNTSENDENRIQSVFPEFIQTVTTFDIDRFYQKIVWLSKDEFEQLSLFVGSLNGTMIHDLHRFDLGIEPISIAIDSDSKYVFYVIKSELWKISYQTSLSRLRPVLVRSDMSTAQMRILNGVLYYIPSASNVDIYFFSLDNIGTVYKYHFNLPPAFQINAFDVAELEHSKQLADLNSFESIKSSFENYFEQIYNRLKKIDLTSPEFGYAVIYNLLTTTFPIVCLVSLVYLCYYFCRCRRTEDKSVI